MSIHLPRYVRSVTVLPCVSTSVNGPPIATGDDVSEVSIAFRFAVNAMVSQAPKSASRLTTTIAIKVLRRIILHVHMSWEGRWNGAQHADESDNQKTKGLLDDDISPKLAKARLCCCNA